MNQNVGKDAKSPNEDDMNFLYALGCQDTNDKILNFIASKFNVIQEYSSRKLKVYDWIYSIKWMLERVNHYDSLELIWFSQKHFNNGAIDYIYENLNKALYFLGNLENFENIQMTEDKKFIVRAIPEIVIPEIRNVEILETNKTIFSGYSLAEQQDILNVYKWYRDELNEQMSTPSFPAIDDELISDVISSMVRDRMAKELKIEENFALVDKICYRFFELEAVNQQKTISGEEIIQLINNENSVTENLNTIAYYLHYILISLGVIPEEKTEFGVGVFSREQSRIIERLLCAITTKKWEKFEQKGSIYYQAIYRMFKFVKENDSWEKDRKLNHLNRAKAMLAEGKFSKAIALLDKDVKIIEAIGQ